MENQKRIKFSFHFFLIKYLLSHSLDCHHHDDFKWGSERERVEGGRKISIKPLTETSNESRKVFNSIKNSQRLTNVYLKEEQDEEDGKNNSRALYQVLRISYFNLQNLKFFSPALREEDEENIVSK